MDTPSKEQLNFHWDAIPKTTKKALDFLSAQPWLAKGGWYLAGGTALALQTGHRTSVDLDFFTTQATFEATEVTGHFKDIKDWEVTSDRPSTIYGSLFKAKVSFIAYPFFLPKQDYVRYGTVKILQPQDIAVMKVVAVSQRGRKRDFFNLYWCAHHLEPLEDNGTIARAISVRCTRFPSYHQEHGLLRRRRERPPAHVAFRCELGKGQGLLQAGSRKGWLTGIFEWTPTPHNQTHPLKLRRRIPFCLLISRFQSLLKTTRLQRKFPRRHLLKLRQLRNRLYPLRNHRIRQLLPYPQILKHR